ncbi:MAG: type II toxin-antitoxin system VapC family toxin [Gammaproteobacteria bacterium]|nr:type II toxin-antitoxin system VapC family toxin [Gammaproteobacteria bacterium]
MSRVLVTDASVVIDLLGRFRPEPIEAVLFEAGTQLVAPELLDIEVLHTLRKFAAQRAIPPRRRATVVEDFRSLRIRRYRHAPLWDDIWELRSNLTAYDGCYVALARQLAATLVTRDERLARAPRTGVEIQLL